MRPSEPFPHFVDDYLAYLQEVHPTVAALDGVHAHDDLLEDFRRSAVENDVRALAGFARRLSEIGEEGLTTTERVEHPVLAANIQARMFDAEEVRTWERDPHLYADILASSLAAQALFAHAPETERARRVLSKLRQAPRLIQAARDNVKDPPGIFVKVAIESFRGIQTFLERDLPRAFSGVDDLHLLGDLADASTEASHVVGEYVTYLEREQGPRARASFRLGRERLERKLKLDEGLPVSVDRLLAIAERELAATQEEFRRTASRLNGGDPLDVWRAAKADHPAPGHLPKAAREQVEQLSSFVVRHKLVTLPEAEPVVVAPTPEFYRWSFASMWTPGPFERSRRARTTTSPTWTALDAGAQEEHLRDFNFPTLWASRSTRCIRATSCTSSTSGRSSRRCASRSSSRRVVHGGLGALLRADDDGGGLPRARPRRAPRAARRGAHPDSPASSSGFGCTARTSRSSRACASSATRPSSRKSSARREAERGTFDPMYVVYAAGKLMLLKLRQDYKARDLGRRYSPRASTTRCWHRAAAPFWAHRRLLLGDGATARIARTDATHAPLRVPMRGLRQPLRGHSEVLRSPLVEICARCGKGPVRRLVSSPAIQFKGTGWYITDYAQKGKPAGDSSGGDGAAAKSDTKEAGESKAPTTGSDSGSSTTDTKATPVPSSGGTK
jgi:predicted nucleic acid-binding Zn ribbon protein